MSGKQVEVDAVELGTRLNALGYVSHGYVGSYDLWAREPGSSQVEDMIAWNPRTNEAAQLRWNTKTWTWSSGSRWAHGWGGRAIKSVATWRHIHQVVGRLESQERSSKAQEDRYEEEMADFYSDLRV